MKEIIRNNGYENKEIMRENQSMKIIYVMKNMS